MRGWDDVAVGVGWVGCVSILLMVCVIWRWCYHRERKTFVEPDSLKAGNHHRHVFDNGVSGKTLFNWSDHPSLALDAVENGWSRFAFTGYNTTFMSSPSKPTGGLLSLGVCGSASGEHGTEESESEAEISWEICQGSSDFLQKIRLNPKGNNLSVNFFSVITTALPLPGSHSFPQQAYFEITLLCAAAGDAGHDWNGKNREGEKIKLIQHSSNGEGNDVEETKAEGKEKGKCECLMFSVGLTVAGSVPLRVPGSYGGSIGFNSNGSVFLDGVKLRMESEKAEWVGSEKVIGCGFDPREKKVFFTLESELVHVIQCQSEEFGTPLYPTLASNMDTRVLVNFGQTAFKYAPANAERTPNPCFVTPLVNHPTPTLGYEDSKELFSMGRIDSQWLNNGSTPRGSHNNNGVADLDDESETELFEIVLESSRKAPASPF